MRRHPIVAPLLLIAALLAVLFIQHTTPRAVAQAQQNRPRGEYTLVSGRLNNGGPNAIYVLDSPNSELIALRWDQSRQMLNGFGYRNLADDASLQIGR